MQVPNVREQSIEQAREMLAAAGLEVGELEEMVFDAEPGTVLRQGPGPGTRVPIGTAVNLWIAAGEAPEVPGIAEFPPPIAVAHLDEVSHSVEVPDVIGRTLAQARGILEEAQLQVGSVGESVSDAEPGTILSQYPPAGTVMEIGDQVNLVVGIREMVEVPHVVGRPLERARRLLEETRLGVGELEEIVSDAQVGTVVWQEPGAGAEVPVGTKVNLGMAIEELVVVPYVQGGDIETARRILAKVGLRVGRIRRRDSDRETGTVLGQDPPAGNRVAIGTPVNLSLAMRRSTVPWVKLVIGLVIVIGVGSLVISKTKKARRGGESVKAKIQTRIKKDEGAQRLESKTPLRSGIGVRIRPVSDPGRQEIETKEHLIHDERREHE